MEQIKLSSYLIVILSLVWLALKLSRLGRRSSSLPPGPPTIPILGNLHLLPRKFSFLKFTEWGKEYGGIISIKVAHETIIVLSDMRIVKEVLDDRGSETSSRPTFHALDAVSEGKFFLLSPAESDYWKMARKVIQPFLSPQAVRSHVPITERETAQLLYDTLQHPDELCNHIVRFTFSSITTLVYGKREADYNSSAAKLFREYIRNFSLTMSPEAAPVDLLPILKYLPERFAPWKRLWRLTREQQRRLYFSFLEHAEGGVKSGIRNGNLVETVLDEQSSSGLSRELLAYIGGTLMDGGTETTATILQSLILCLIKSPSSLQKAQKEIDEVVGSQRLPTIDDLKALPYIQALIKETHRLRPAGPTAVPHSSTKDIQFREFTIPKNAPILINIWGILHDPDLFERPDEFWPERYMLTPDGTKPGLDKGYSIRATLQFGSGKRLCPGINFANISTSLAVMRLLWAFDFTATGQSISDTNAWDFTDDYTDGVVFAPHKFRCHITPRSKEKAEIIKECYKGIVHGH